MFVRYENSKYNIFITVNKTYRRYFKNFINEGTTMQNLGRFGQPLNTVNSYDAAKTRRLT